jgi:acyl-CoA thioesterase-1
MEAAMKICVLGDSVAKGVLLDEESGRYFTGKRGFAARLAEDPGVEVENLAVFGCTVTKGLQLVKRHETRISGADAVLLEFGGNDCDYHWDEIAADPAAGHEPKTPVDCYLQDYTKLMCELEKLGTLPVILTLPPIHAVRYFNWFSRDMTDEGKANIMGWLHGDVEYIHKWHRMYNDNLCALADSLGAAMVDIRADFLAGGDYGQFLCADGIHPNEVGQEMIYNRLKGLQFSSGR